MFLAQFFYLVNELDAEFHAVVDPLCYILLNNSPWTRPVRETMEDYEQFCLRSLEKLQPDRRHDCRTSDTSGVDTSLIFFHGRRVLSPIVSIILLQMCDIHFKPKYKNEKLLKKDFSVKIQRNSNSIIHPLNAMNVWFSSPSL